CQNLISHGFPPDFVSVATSSAPGRAGAFARLRPSTAFWRAARADSISGFDSALLPPSSRGGRLPTLTRAFPSSKARCLAGLRTPTERSRPTRLRSVSWGITRPACDLHYADDTPALRILPSVPRRQSPPSGRFSQ